MAKKYKKIHFIGIGGAGMSGIAEVLHNLGFKITGSDIQENEVTKHLEEIGIKIYYGHHPDHVDDADLVVISTAVKEDNIEVKKAREKQIPVIRRALMLAELTRIKYSIAVSGAHGKTTTTSMIADVLAKGGLDPTVIVGGVIKGLKSGAKLGHSDFLVVEADESDMSFLHLFPTIVVITNIDLEHLDCYGDLNNIKKAFIQFSENVPFYGAVVANIDDRNTVEILPSIERKKITYGFALAADVYAKDIKRGNSFSEFSVYYKKSKIGDVRLNVPGIHNIKNALAAVAVGLELGIDTPHIIAGLQEFKGVARRFEIKGKKNDIIIVDDYGHHPNEIIETLKTARDFHSGRIVVIFQPHRYTRTYYLHEQFGTAFFNADLLIITEIYPAGEKPIEGVTAKLIYDAVKKYGHKNALYIPELSNAVEFLKKELKPGDMLLTIGAGNIYKVGDEILRTL
ncbi:MAG: UDP-N-acetylmuramate--L-alanine ligase [candidate division WOR-3 bacterium]